MTKTATALSNPSTPQPAPTVALVAVHLAANSGKPGRPANSKTGRNLSLRCIHRALAIELQVPLTWITHYHPAHWALCLNRLTTDRVERVMERLRHTLYHPTAGRPVNLSPEEVGYAAGFIDGEGCLSIVKTAPRKGRKRPDYRAAFQISQSNAYVLQRVQKTLGAHSYLRKGKRTIALNKVPYYLQIMGPVHIVHALAVIYAHLDPNGKKPQAEAMFRFLVETRAWKYGRGTPASLWSRRNYWKRRLVSLK